MNKLSKRLAVISSFIEDNSKVIDIGCDHGLLSIYLVNKYKNIRVIASDINKNALDTAINNIKKEGLDNRIETRLGNGLDVVSSDEIDTIVIAGMGANTIVGILKYAPDKLVNVNNMGYYIEDEVLVEDKNIIYTVIRFSKGKKKYSYRELYLGPVLSVKNDILFKKKNNKELNTLKLIIKNIDKGHYLYRFKIKRNIKILESIK